MRNVRLYDCVIVRLFGYILFQVQLFTLFYQKFDLLSCIKIIKQMFIVIVINGEFI